MDACADRRIDSGAWHRGPAALRSLLIAIPIASATLVPEEAAACFPETCSYYEQWTSLAPGNAAAIPIDGILLLQATRAAVPIDRVPPEELLASVTLAVTRDGQPVAGTLEATEVDDVLAWRPAAPLVPGATYEAIGSLVNPAGPSFCAPDLLPLEFEFHADLGPAAALMTPTVSAVELLTLRPRSGIENLACCDGAMPSEHTSDCGGFAGMDWDEGVCTAIRGSGWLSVELSIEHGLPPATASLVSRKIVRSDVMLPARLSDILDTESFHPFCTQVILRNLATGETVMSAKQCHGDADAEQLGDQDIDPNLALGDQCNDPIYTCESRYVSMFETRWDASACQPWGAEGATDGCSCRQGPPNTLSWLVWLVPGLMRRRRP